VTLGTPGQRVPRPGPPPQGAEPNYKNPRGRRWREPPDHALGRSRGGISTKIHQLVDGRGRPLVIDVTAGQAGDSTMLAPLLSQLAVARPGRGRPRTRPVAVLGDKAYSSRANRALLRSRGITAVIPQPSDQVNHRLRRGSAGGRPPAFDPDTYKGRNVVERSFNDHKQWRGIATRYDKLAATYRGGVVLRAITLWLNHLGDMP
jgi:transposase